MKRKVIAAMVGACGMLGVAVSSNAQQILFDNYGSSPYYQVRYNSSAALAPAGLAGASAGANVDVELGFALGANQTSGFQLIPSSITAINPSLSATDNGVGPTVHGWFQGPAVTVTGWSAGPVTFEILAWVASGVGAGDGSLAGSLYSNVAAPTIWTEPTLPNSGNPAGYFTALSGDTVLTAVPEPTTIALLGLGAVGLLAARRRKA